ncbi:MAG: hypothetical protein FJ279_17175 [Planctomycetes bacterium]|nr:hypothetical protein [Planctomycetota bacterium]
MRESATRLEIVDASTFFGSWPKQSLDMSVDALLRLMDKEGIARALTVSAKGIWYDYEEGNQDTLAVCEANERFIPVGTIDPRKWYGKGDPVARLRDQGFRICRLFNAIQAWPIEYAPFDDLLSLLSEHRMPFVLDVAPNATLTQISERVWGCDVPVILVGISYGNLAEAISVCRKNLDLHIETQKLNSPDGFEILVSELGADRLIFGSRSPFDYAQSPLLMLKSTKLSDADKAKIAGRNILRILEGQ